MNRRAALFLLLYVAIILYLSLYPWRFGPNYGFRTLIWVPLVARRTILDAALNLAFYIPLGAAAFASFRRLGAFAFVVALALGTLVSFSVEYAQLSIPSRLGTLTDLVFNCAGTLLGIAVAFMATRPWLPSRLRALYSPGVLLLGLWAVWQALLFLPRYGPAIDIGHQIVGLLVLALLAIRRLVRDPTLLLLISGVLLIWLAVDELRPFQFQSPPRPIWWLPFESWFVGAPDSYYGTFFGKLFFYTAILWAERSAGIPWIWTLAAPGAILAAGEFAQRYLPVRTPEALTDLALLAAGAVLLHVAEPRDLHNKN